MCRLFETIRVINGRLCHPDYHQRRMNASRLELFGFQKLLTLTGVVIPEDLTAGEYKCKVIYHEEVEEILFEPYTRKIFRNVAMVECNRISYPYKFLNRALFDEALSRYPEYDELIFVRNGLLTDSTFSNLAFFDGDRWYTPSTPLLQGTCLLRLLESGRIIRKEITPKDIGSFTILSFINAMLEPGRSTVSTQKIIDLIQ